MRQTGMNIIITKPTVADIAQLNDMLKDLKRIAKSNEAHEKLVNVSVIGKLFGFSIVN